ncbi:hypothetical protein [Streptomyces sp. CB00455]|uniref:hypothetical protein n=1 Tax=Streptomyces sp. CB00455 TaxID=1703927 RepID=UPI000A5DBA55
MLPVRFCGPNDPVLKGSDRGFEGELDVLAVRGLGLIGLNDSLLRAHLARAGVRFACCS